MSSAASKDWSLTPLRLSPLISVFVLVFAGVLALAYGALAVQSGVRAYVAGESQWSKSEKDAFIQLARYAETGDEDAYAEFQMQMTVPLGDHSARLAMVAPELDRPAAVAGLLAGRNSIEDIPMMIRLFRWGGQLPYMRDAIAIWTEADPAILELSELGARMHALHAAGRPDPQALAALRRRAFDINADLRPLEDRFSASLARGARYVNALLFASMALGALLMLGLGFALVRVILKGLHRSEARFRDTFEQAAVGICHAAPDGTLLRVNDRYCEIVGRPREELVGSRFDSILLHDDLVDHQPLTGSGQDGRRMHVMKRLLERSDGAEVWVRITSTLVTHPEASETYYLNVLEDISGEEALNARLTHQARHDALTGLLNRAEFERRAMRALQEVARGGPEGALCYLDLDQFKVINDTLGHMAGDELLRQLGTELIHHLRPSDTLARLGGDELAVLLENCSTAAASNVAEALRRGVDDKRFLWNGREYHVSASIGVVPITPDTGSVQQLMSDADEACYAAKDKGRNLVHVHEPNSERAARRHVEMQWVTRLREALSGDGLMLMYQSIRPLAPHPRSGQHFEVLLRMQQPSGEMVSPGGFLAAAERYNLGSRVDEWVVNETLAWLSAHRHRLPPISLCSINLSAQSLGNARFLQMLESQIGRYGVPTEWLCFELTETAAVADLESAGRFIASLRDIGCSFSLDDFGSGMSSFAYLRSLPVDFLKIDGFFIRGIARDPINRAVVDSINDISHTLGKRTIGEFVEDEAILKVATEIGIDYAQGYAIASPRPLAELLRTPLPVEAAATAARYSRDSASP